MHCGDDLGEGCGIDVLFVDEHTTDAILTEALCQALNFHINGHLQSKG